jgi:hypothetical protein
MTLVALAKTYLALDKTLLALAKCFVALDKFLLSWYIRAFESGAWPVVLWGGLKMGQNGAENGHFSGRNRGLKGPNWKKNASGETARIRRTPRSR